MPRLGPTRSAEPPGIVAMSATYGPSCTPLSLAVGCFGVLYVAADRSAHHGAHGLVVLGRQLAESVRFGGTEPHLHRLRPRVLRGCVHVRHCTTSAPAPDRATTSTHSRGRRRPQRPPTREEKSLRVYRRILFDAACAGHETLNIADHSPGDVSEIMLNVSERSHLACPLAISNLSRDVFRFPQLVAIDGYLLDAVHQLAIGRVDVAQPAEESPEGWDGWKRGDARLVGPVVAPERLSFRSRCWRPHSCVISCCPRHTVVLARRATSHLILLIPERRV